MDMLVEGILWLYVDEDLMEIIESDTPDLDNKQFFAKWPELQDIMDCLEPDGYL